MPQGDLTLIFDGVGVSQSDRNLCSELAASLNRLEGRFGEAGAAVERAHLKLDRIHRDLGFVAAHRPAGFGRLRPRADQERPQRW